MVLSDRIPYVNVYMDSVLATVNRVLPQAAKSLFAAVCGSGLTWVLNVLRPKYLLIFTPACGRKSLTVIRVNLFVGISGGIFEPLI